MRELLTSLDDTTDPCTHPEFKKHVQDICSRYVSGVWENVPSDKLELKRIKGATSNILFICGIPDEFKKNNGSPSKVLLRICFNPDKENSLTDTIVFALLSERNMGPKLYGVFDEGRIEEFIESRPLTTEELSKHEVCAEVAKLLARVHQLKIPILKRPEYLHKAFDRWNKQLLKTVGKDHRFKVSDQFRDLMPNELSCEDLEKEVQYLKSQMAKSKSPVTFSHNDLQENNILLPNQKKRKDSNELGLVFIDFEYASFNYRGFDFGNHFVEYTLCYDVDEPPYYKVMPERFPDHEQMLKFMRNYLLELKPNAPDSELEKEAEELVHEALPFVPCSHLFWAIWAFLQSVTSPLTFGFSSYAQDRLYLYFKTKHLLKKFDETLK
ncbi:hypothetical protein M3Y97_00856800 [Aphelenchoides bicaudatus]|nr:hypothetical protein M3Y97_00856800 [Aphelenchoides bicaudatus]